MAGFDEYVKLLLHMDGEHNGTVFTDETGKTVNRYGAVTNQVVTKFGTASGYFDGSNDYLELDDSADWAFGTDSFTIDFWVYPKAWDTVNPILVQRVDGDNYWTISFSYNGGNIFFFVKNGGTDVASYSSTVALALDEWAHVAVVRNGTGTSCLKIYINGVDRTPTVHISKNLNDRSMPDFATSLKVANIDTYYTRMYLDEVRISKGVARWTAGFTPPAEPYSGATQKVLAANVSSVGIPDRGATVDGVLTVSKTMLGFLGADGAGTKGVAKGLVSAVAVLGDFIKSRGNTEAKALTANISTAASFIAGRILPKALVVNLSITASELYPAKLKKALESAATLTASVAKTVGKTYTTAVALAGTATKTISKHLRAVNTRATGRAIKMRDKELTATASLTAGLTRVAEKRLAAMNNITGVIAKKVGKKLSATEILSALAIKQAGKKLAARVRVSASKSKGIPKELAADLAANGTTQKQAGKYLTAAIDSASAALKTMPKTFVAPLSIGAARTSKTKKRLIGQVRLSARFSRALSLILTAATTLAGTAIRVTDAVLTIPKALTAQLRARASTRRKIGKRLTASLPIVAQVAAVSVQIETILQSVVERLTSMVKVSRATTLEQVERIVVLEVENLAKIGDTVRLTASFYSFSNALADPANVKITIYDGRKTKLVDGVAATKSSTGIYYYEYLVPSTGFDPLTYEFSGTLEGSTVLGRATIEREWV